MSILINKYKETFCTLTSIEKYLTLIDTWFIKYIEQSLTINNLSQCIFIVSRKLTVLNSNKGNHESQTSMHPPWRKNNSIAKIKQ